MEGTSGFYSPPFWKALQSGLKQSKYYEDPSFEIKPYSNHIRKNRTVGNECILTLFTHKYEHLHSSNNSNNSNNSKDSIPNPEDYYFVCNTFDICPKMSKHLKFAKSKSKSNENELNCRDCGYFKEIVSLFENK